MQSISITEYQRSAISRLLDEDEADRSVGKAGEPEGHPFRGNQYTHGITGGGHGQRALMPGAKHALPTDPFEAPGPHSVDHQISTGSFLDLPQSQRDALVAGLTAPYTLKGSKKGEVGQTRPAFGTIDQIAARLRALYDAASAKNTQRYDGADRTALAAASDWYRRVTTGETPAKGSPEWDRAVASLPGLADAPGCTIGLVSEAYGVGFRTVCGMVAVLSANTAWSYRTGSRPNLACAARLCKILAANPTITITPEDAAKWNNKARSGSGTFRTAGESRPGAIVSRNKKGEVSGFKWQVSQIQPGTYRLSDLPADVVGRIGNMDRALFAGAGGTTGWPNMTDAVNIWRTGNVDGYLTGPKRRAFFNGLYTEGRSSTTVIDRHIYRAALGDASGKDNYDFLGPASSDLTPTTLQRHREGDPKHNWSPDGPYYYLDEAMKQANRDAGRSDDQLQEFQAIVWYAWLADHPGAERSKRTREEKKIGKAEEFDNTADVDEPITQADIDLVNSDLADFGHWLTSFNVADRLTKALLSKGDRVGHKFRGNQHTGGIAGGEAPPRHDEMLQSLQDQLDGKAPWSLSFMPEALPGMDERLGQCYVLSGHEMMNARHGVSDTVPGKNLRLVHGTIQYGDLPPLDHAWVQTDEAVKEPATGRLFTHKAFKRLFNPTEHNVYTIDEAMKAMAKAKHFGPWNTVSKGDRAGHQFHGNQYTRGMSGGMADAFPASTAPIRIEISAKAYDTLHLNEQLDKYQPGALDYSPEFSLSVAGQTKSKVRLDVSPATARSLYSDFDTEHDVLAENMRSAFDRSETASIAARMRSCRTAMAAIDSAMKAAGHETPSEKEARLKPIREAAHREAVKRHEQQMASNQEYVRSITGYEEAVRRGRMTAITNVASRMGLDSAQADRLLHIASDEPRRLWSSTSDGSIGAALKMRQRADAGAPPYTDAELLTLVEESSASGHASHFTGTNEFLGRSKVRDILSKRGDLPGHKFRGNQYTRGVSNGGASLRLKGGHHLGAGQTSRSRKPIIEVITPDEKSLSSLHREIDHINSLPNISHSDRIVGLKRIMQQHWSLYEKYREGPNKDRKRARQHLKASNIAGRAMHAALDQWQQSEDYRNLLPSDVIVRPKKNRKANVAANLSRIAQGLQRPEIVRASGYISPVIGLAQQFAKGDRVGHEFHGNGATGGRPGSMGPHPRGRRWEDSDAHNEAKRIADELAQGRKSTMRIPIRDPHFKRRVLELLPSYIGALSKEAAGHKFRGNQWTGGIGGQGEKPKSKRERPSENSIAAYTVREILERPTHGVSLRLATAFEPKSGTMVSLPGHEEMIGKASDLTPNTVSQYIAKHRKALDAKGNYLGGWLDTSTGAVYLDVSKRHRTVEDGIRAGVKADQIAIVTLHGKPEDAQFITLKGPGSEEHRDAVKRVLEGGKFELSKADDQHLVRFYLNHNDTPQRIVAQITALQKEHGA